VGGSLDVLGRVDVLWRIVETMGGTTAMVASIVLSSWFSLGLIVVGVAYTVFVGEPKTGTQRHVWWPYAAAIIFFLCVTTMAAVAIYGAYELQLRKAYADGAAGVPRNTPANAQSRPQTPLYQEGYGGLTSDQSRILLVELPKIKTLVPAVYFTMMQNDFGANNFILQFEDLFRRSGFTNLQRGNQTPRGPDEEGLMIAVHDRNNIPVAAQKVMEAFEIADIPYKVIRIADGTSPDIQFSIFVGPRPIRWH